MSAWNKKNGPFILLAVFILMAVASIFYLMRPARDEVNASKAKAQLERQKLVDSSNDQDLQKFNLTGFDRNGKKFWNLQGESAKIDPGQTVYLDQNVTLKFQGDTVVKTDHVRWSPDGGTLRTAAPVFVDHHNAKIKGLGAFGRPNENFIQLNKNIEMLVLPNTLISCDGPMKVYYNENKMIFYRRVKVKDDRGVVTANRMDVFFEDEGNKVDHIIANGDVVIERGSDTTRSQRAVYMLATGAVRLEGNPEVTLHKSGSSKLMDGLAAPKGK